MSTRDVFIDDICSALDEQGYCIVPSVIEPAEADRARTVLEGIVEDEITDTHRKEKKQRVGRIAVKHPVFLDLMCHPLIVEIWRKWLAPDIICSTWSSITLYPGSPGHGGHPAWHTDYPYWSLENPWPSGKLTGQTIWLLDDFTEENGATGVVPYSQHKRTAPTHANQWREDARIITGERGSVAVLDGSLWHASTPNRSNRPRSALLGMYIRPCCLAQEDMRGQLADIKNPSELTRQLMGENQYQPEDVK